MMSLDIRYFYWLAGVLLIGIAVQTFRDAQHPRRIRQTVFWTLFGLLFLFGDSLPAEACGAMTLAMIGAAISGKAAAPSQPPSGSRSIGNKVFWPCLLLSALTAMQIVAAKALPSLPFRLPAMQSDLLSLGVASRISLALACRLAGARPAQAVQETRRLLEKMGPAFLLPQILAVLGLMLADAGVGKAVAHVATSYLALDIRWVAVLAYVLGMALFTMIMGNAFAAFPVMTAGIGIPFLIGVHHGDAAVMAAIGMFSGYCGTLMTPMAANFNIVPAALLELDDKNAVIKAQTPTALALLAVNALLLNWLMFR
ncbi:DUF979 domain-containing protein [Chromobacterium sp. IIBBL 290-4]|uniref:DUF979 domain-containing protein n=1 Tax=Chromobacterium sp. IIBBL 290-4 TaxID=2953890 RepID=UPI0020B77EF3|nr:DUF979 domain-containing protein [Chromobacterium sp. IIBBL 290-4]UTH74386.1 DUF979 domain-containing protein [Chromobacterium sp. IIBBL 290-4]